ncbi:MAG: (2Fe-2S)-binding protein [Chloroflexi bacterium]|nr:(2Fe-2S)-binding protein [Chloroflexota bacterium]
MHRPASAGTAATEARIAIDLVVNGERVALEVEPRRLLVDVLREDLDLTGTKVGCDTSSCGTCTVHLDGRAVKSCTVLAVQADGSAVRTVEDLAPDSEHLHPLQAAFVEHHGLQCGFCTPGMLMTALDLLARDPDPSDGEIRHAIHGNLCRCTGYQSIVASIQEGAAVMRGEPPRTWTEAHAAPRSTAPAPDR